MKSKITPLRIIKKIMRVCIIKFLKIFPLKENRILFCAHGGREFSCNIRAMYEYLKNLGEDFEFIWVINDFSKIPDSEKIIKVNPKWRIRYWFYNITSKYAFNNCGFEFSLKKKGSLWCNTWHGGGAFKRINWKQNWTPELERCKRHNEKSIDIYVSSSKKFTEIQSKDEFLNPAKFVPTGMPRNAAFFDSQMIKKMRGRSRDFFNFSDEDFVVLYAPTYRGLEETTEYNLNFDFEGAAARFKELTGKKVKFLFRAHRLALHSLNLENDFIVDATTYPEMQDLLCGADFLITDFSSSMWDYALLKKPCMLFTPDLKNYSAERGFYTPVETWPFYFYETNEDFIKNLSLKVDEDKILEYQNLVQSYENPNSCEMLWEICRKKAAELK